MSGYRVGDRTFSDTDAGRAEAYGYSRTSGLAVVEDTAPRQQRPMTTPVPSLSVEGLEPKFYAILGRRVLEVVRETISAGAEEQSIVAEQEHRLHAQPRRVQPVEETAAERAAREQAEALRPGETEAQRVARVAAERTGHPGESPAQREVRLAAERAGYPAGHPGQPAGGVVLTDAERADKARRVARGEPLTERMIHGA